MLTKARLAAGWIGDTWSARRKYRTAFDAFRTVLLRFSVTGTGKRLLKGSIVPIQLRALNHPVWLRYGTYDIYALLEIFLWGEYEPARSWNLSGKKLIVDLGANVGLATRYFASLGPSCVFLSVEPDSENFEILNKNCGELAESGRFQSVQAFVSSQDGNSAIDRTRGSLGFRMSQTDEQTAPETIRCINIGRLLMEYASGHDTIGLLKCDIEGAEAEVFRNSRPWIGNVEHLIVETHAPYTAAGLKEDLARNGWHWESLTVHEKLTDNQATSTCFFKRST